MRVKTLLVCLTTADQAETVLKVAVPLARRLDAHLVGLRAVETILVYPGIAIHIPERAFVAFKESQRVETAALRKIFEQFTEGESFVSEFRLVRAEASTATGALVENARAADLVVMSHEDHDTDRDDRRSAQVQMIRRSGRPVVVVPLGYDGAEIGENILVGWSDTREAARAAHDMLLIAQTGAAVTVLRVGRGHPDQMRDTGAIDLAETFSRHGLRATLETRDPGARPVSDVLGRVAVEKGADLIVTGAFGHSRAYDFVLGATTYALLRDARLPILFST